VYFTAFPDAGGEVRYRADVYGRDGALFDALVAAGLELPAKSG
jgi:L,D-transpeptidase YcbB